MRKIERQMLGAINTPGKDWRNNNTSVEWNHNDTACDVRLHGHKIAAIDFAKHVLIISDCGWQTSTTKSRLNALLGDLTPGRAGIYQRNYQWFLDRGHKEHEMDSNTPYALHI